jgi:hypothetical protein
LKPEIGKDAALRVWTSQRDVPTFYLMTDPVPLDRPISERVRKQRVAPGFDEETKWIRWLIWIYIILWLIEGGLRRWFLPGLATPLLLIRDPLVIFIYFLAFTKNIFPLNGFFYSGVVLAVLTFANAFIFGHKNLEVALYGVRCDFLHVPLIFIMARALRQKDLMAMAKVAMWLVIPYTILLVAQFYAPQDAWVNRGVGGSLEGAGYEGGALGHFRPPGTFSFITGPSELYPLFTACWFVLAIGCKISPWQMVLSGAAIVIAIPISISRSLFISVAIVGVVGVIALFSSRTVSKQTLLKVFLALMILGALTAQLPAFKDGMEAFKVRWETSTTENGGFQEAIVDRVINDLFGSVSSVKFSGLGTGFSTNVGQKILTQEVGFGASEAEWGRLLFDNGLILGILLVAYRIALTGYIVWIAYNTWRHYPQSLVFASAAFFLLLNGEWGQATTLGSAIIAGGLTLAAASNQQSERLKIPSLNKAQKRRLKLRRNQQQLITGA